MSTDSNRLSTLEAKVSNLEMWQERQNGKIDRIDERVEKVQYWLLGIAGGVAVQLLVQLATAG